LGLIVIVFGNRSLSKVLCKCGFVLQWCWESLFKQGVVLVWCVDVQCCWKSQFKQCVVLVLGCFVNVVGIVCLSDLLCKVRVVFQCCWDCLLTPYVV
jgi:hypothetical protein